MKSSNIILGTAIAIFAIGVFVSSCDRNEILPGTISNQPQGHDNREIDGHAMRLELLDLSDSERRSFFENLSEDEKVALWHDKMRSVLILDGWSSSQKSMLSSIDAQILNGIWIPNSDREAYFVNEFLPGWLIEAGDLFTENQLGWIIAAPDDYASGPFSPPNTDDCDCSPTSDWCPGSTFCNTTNCSTSSHGCGTFWVKKCLGECGL